MKDRCAECGKYWILGMETCPVCGEPTEKWFKREHPDLNRGGQSFGIQGSERHLHEDRQIPVKDDAQSDYIAELLTRIRAERGDVPERNEERAEDAYVLPEAEDTAIDSGIAALLANVRAEREAEERSKQAEEAAKPLPESAPLTGGLHDPIELSNGESLDFFGLFSAEDSPKAQVAAQLAAAKREQAVPTDYRESAAALLFEEPTPDGQVVLPTQDSDKAELDALYERLRKKMGS